MIQLDLLGEHQAGSPTFADWNPPVNPAELRAEVEEEVADPRSVILLADLDGRLVAIATAPVEYSGMHQGLARPEKACILGYAATLPEVRGSGAGSR